MSEKSGHESFALRFGGLTVEPGKLVLGIFNPGPHSAQRTRDFRPALTFRGAQAGVGMQSRTSPRPRPDADHQQRKVKSSNTFTSAVIDFVEQHAKPKTQAWKQTARCSDLRRTAEVIRRSLCDRWANKPLASVTANDVFNIVQEVRLQGTPG